MKRPVVILFMMAAFSLLLAACISQPAVQVPVTPVQQPGPAVLEPAFDVTPTPTPLVPPPTSDQTQNSRPVQEKKAPDSMEPAAGICAEPREEVVTITAGMDNPPMPRCTQILAWQSLKFENATGQEVSFTLGVYDFNLEPGGEMLVDRPAGEYLQPGVHRLTLSAGYTSEIWLREP
jgi:hypothetical protein